MKKKLLSILFLCVFSTCLTACGNNTTKNNPETTKTPNEKSKTQNNVEENEKEDIKSNQESETSNSYTIDGITISANSFSVEPYEDNSGEYTKRIVLNFTIKNDTDNAFGYTTGWEGKLKDGYKLKNYADISKLQLNQVTSKSEKTDVAYFLLNDSIDPDEIIASYKFMDYTEEYWQDFGKIIKGEMQSQEFESKYGEYKALEFNLKKQ